MFSNTTAVISFKLTPLNLQTLATVSTGIGYKMIALIAKAFAGMLS